MTTTQKLQKRLNDSKAARWTALIIVSFTMMMAYFFTDVMGPLEAPLTTKGKLVYFDNGTYLSADSLSKVCIEKVGSVDEITEGKTYNLVYSENNKLKKEVIAVNQVYTLSDTTIATTGKFLLIKKSLVSGERLVVEITHERTYVTSSVDGDCRGALSLSSNLFRLNVGDNVLKPEADAGLSNMQVNIDFATEIVGIAL